MCPYCPHPWPLDIPMPVRKANKRGTHFNTIFSNPDIEGDSLLSLLIHVFWHFIFYSLKVHFTTLTWKDAVQKVCSLWFACLLLVLWKYKIFWRLIHTRDKTSGHFTILYLICLLWMFPTSWKCIIKLLDCYFSHLLTASQLLSVF